MGGKQTKISAQSVRFLDLVLGDQLNRDSALFDDHQPATDRVWMAEVREESTHVPSHKARTVLFLSAMRHFAKTLQKDGFHLLYQKLDQPHAHPCFRTALAASIKENRPETVRVVQPGEYRVLEILRSVCDEAKVPLKILDDRHFFSTLNDFENHARGRKQLRQEFFYRELRTRYQILMDDGEPVGGQWNYDQENRESFGKLGPGLTAAPQRFPPDEITREVIDIVEREFPKHPGDLTTFDWPVTPQQAKEALKDFLNHRLADFGRYQDAMWTGQPFLNHSLLSASLNLKILDPRLVVTEAEKRYRSGQVGLAAAEGFIRQILGWREYVRGIYWHFMPAYLEKNTWNATSKLPGFYWKGKTEMRCLADSIGQTLRLGYAHHIQRLMVTGLFAMLFGVNPREVHEWYLAVYVDAVEWVELPNTLGMSQNADGGIMASKPYAASGKYIDRMSNYCKGCRFQPDHSTGEQACPFTVLYWDFLMRHENTLAANPRMVMQVRNLSRLTPEKRKSISQTAKRIRLEMV